MIAAPRPVTLGGRTFVVPPLPLRSTMVAYPICRKLTLANLLERCMAAGNVLDVDEGEMADVVELAFCCAQAAEPELSREEFEALPVSPPELLDAFLVARYQTGAWVPPTAQEGDLAPGEAEGAESPPTSTSTGSSPA